MSYSKHRAQTSLEVLLITGIILVSIVVLIPSYMNSERGISIVSLTRSSAGIACNYLNMGVIVSGSQYEYYSPLNELLGSGIKYSLHLKSVRYSESNDKIYITVDIVNYGTLSNRENVENGISNFIKMYISSHSSARIVDGNLIYKGKSVIINVRVAVE